VDRRSPQEATSDDRELVAETVGRAFPGALPGTRRTLVASAEVRAFRSGQTVIPQGDDSRTGLVLDGHFGFRRTTIDGREVITLIGSRGQLGPTLPIARRPSSSDLLALSAGRVALWPASDFQALAAEDAGFALALLEHVLQAVEEVIERMDGLLYQNAQRRVARVLDQHAEIIFGEEPAITRAYLPALIGTSREMTGRVLRQLESDGVVKRIGRNRLRLVDAARLARTAAPPSTPQDGERRNKFLAVPRRAMQE
jgi:CRP/FNR family transcriptional regulator, cyclic AMP receptor protein